MNRPTLDELALKYGTDKSSKHHGYTHVYEGLFEPLRDEFLNVLELGWGAPKDPDKGGASAMMWRDYFPNSTISVIDIQKNNLDERHDGINLRQGSQSDPNFISEVAEEFGPFDIVIDDASHISSLTIASWELLYPHMKDGSIYVLEDCHSSYHDFFYGKDEAHPNPSGNVETANQYFKRLSDEVNFLGRKEKPDWDLFPRKHWNGYYLESVTFMFDLIIVKKRGKNTWPSTH